MAFCWSALARDGFFVGVCWLGMAFLCVASARDGFVGMHQLGMPFLSVA